MSDLLAAIELVHVSRPDANLPLPTLASMSSAKGTELRPEVEAIAQRPSYSPTRLPLAIDPEGGSLKLGRIIIIIIALTGVNFLSSLCNGFITIGLPRMASDLSLTDNLILYPSSAY